MPHSVFLSAAATRQRRSFPEDIRARLDEAIGALADSPNPVGSLKMSGSGNLYRLRVGDYRVIYAVNAEEVVVQAIGHRREVYR